jgi:hypothetical protein
MTAGGIMATAIEGWHGSRLVSPDESDCSLFFSAHNAREVAQTRDLTHDAPFVIRE